MVRRLRETFPPQALIAAAAVAVLAGAITIAASILGAGGGGRSLPSGVPIAATAKMEPTSLFFADELTARIDIAVDRHKVDPNRVRIATVFRPFDRIGQTKTRRDAGRITYISETYRLRCLSRLCVQELPAVAAAAGGAKPPQRRATQFLPARVYVSGKSSVHPLLLEWPVVESVTRVNQTEAQQQSFFYHASLAPPAPSYAVAPNTLLWLLLLAFLVALGIPVALVARRVLAWRRARHAARPELPPLERALRLLEWANRQPDGKNRRRALELVAKTLLSGGPDVLGDEARELAWSPPTPEAEQAGQLGARVRTKAGGNGATPT